MLHTLRGRNPHRLRVSFSNWPRIRLENALPSPAFSCSPPVQLPKHQYPRTSGERQLVAAAFGCQG